MRRGNLGDSRTWNIPQLACSANITLANREYHRAKHDITAPWVQYHFLLKTKKIKHIGYQVFRKGLGAR